MTTEPDPSSAQQSDHRRAAARDRIGLWFRFWLLGQIVFGLYASGFVWLAVTKGIDQARRELLTEPGAILFLAVPWSFGLLGAAGVAVVAAKFRESLGRGFALGVLPWVILTAEATVAVALLV